MPANEKEYNGNLFDQLTILERLEAAKESGNFEAVAASIRAEINRKLYQKPPLIDDND